MALGSKPGTGCSTPVRPQLTALETNLAPSVLRRCGPGRRRWETNLAPSVLHRCAPRLFYAGAMYHGLSGKPAAPKGSSPSAGGVAWPRTTAVETPPAILL